jgi:hypothetical protein
MSINLNELHFVYKVFDPIGYQHHWLFESRDPPRVYDAKRCAACMAPSVHTQVCVKQVGAPDGFIKPEYRPRLCKACWDKLIKQVRE